MDINIYYENRPDKITQYSKERGQYSPDFFTHRNIKNVVEVV